MSAPARLDGDRCLRAGEGQCGFDLHRDGVADRDILRERAKSGRCDFHVIRVGRDIGEAEASRPPPQ